MPISIDERGLSLLDAVACPSAETHGREGGPRKRIQPTRSMVANNRESRLDALVRTIEGQIVPRLLMARGAAATRAPRRDAAGAGLALGQEHVAELVRLLLDHDSTVASAYVADLRREGAGVERICLDLLALAARRLGALWENDEVDVVQVTLGLCRLQTLLREVSADRDEGGHSDLKGSILLVPELGEEHTFGLQLVGEFFRRAQWDVWMEHPESPSALLDLVAHEHFSAVGLTVGCAERLPGLATRITSIRRASRNRALCVLVGGPLFLARPELATQVGADATASDGHEAVSIACALTQARASSREMLI